MIFYIVEKLPALAYQSLSHFERQNPWEQKVPLSME
jgi:hypothetical protein